MGSHLRGERRLHQVARGSPRIDGGVAAAGARHGLALLRGADLRVQRVPLLPGGARAVRDPGRGGGRDGTRGHEGAPDPPPPPRLSVQPRIARRGGPHAGGAGRPDRRQRRARARGDRRAGARCGAVAEPARARSRASGRRRPRRARDARGQGADRAPPAAVGRARPDPRADQGRHDRHSGRPRSSGLRDDRLRGGRVRGAADRQPQRLADARFARGRQAGHRHRAVGGGAPARRPGVPAGRDRREGDLARPDLLWPGTDGARWPHLQNVQVPLDAGRRRVGHGRRLGQAGGRPPHPHRGLPARHQPRRDPAVLERLPGPHVAGRAAPRTSGLRGTSFATRSPTTCSATA